MGVSLDRIVRFPAESALSFGWTLKPELFDAAMDWHPRLPSWLRELEGAAVRVDEALAERCVIRFCSAAVCATAEITRAANGTFLLDLRARRHASEGECEWSWQQENVRAMLGGKNDAYLAVMTASGAVPALRLRYNGAKVEVFVLAAAFAERLPALVRALTPGELKLGELMAPDTAGRRAKGASPCGCH